MKRIYILAFIMALITAVAVYYFSDSLQRSAQPEEVDTAYVVVALYDIPANTLVNEEMVSLTKLPTEAINLNAATTLTDVVGKITKYPIASSEQVLYSKISERGDDADKLSYALSEGQRAISIAVEDFAGVSGYIEPGDYVDVIATVAVDFEPEDPEDEEAEVESRSVSYYIAENLLVLETGLKEGDVVESTSNYTLVTLAGTPEQVLAVYYASTNGQASSSQKLTLVLRPVLDGGSSDLEYYYPTS